MTTKLGKAPLSVFPKDTTEWREYILNRDHVDHNYGALTLNHAADFSFYIILFSIHSTNLRNKVRQYVVSRLLFV